MHVHNIENPNAKYFFVVKRSPQLPHWMALASLGLGGVVAFLCTEDASRINGQRIEASGDTLPSKCLLTGKTSRFKKSIKYIRKKIQYLTTLKTFSFST